MVLTVTGIFNEAEQAQQAFETLISSGFMHDCIDIGIGSDSFCCNPDNDTRKFAKVTGRAMVVTVRAEIEELARLAAGILDDSGAVDIEKKGAEYGFGGEIVFS